MTINKLKKKKVFKKNTGKAPYYYNNLTRYGLRYIHQHNKVLLVKWRQLTLLN